MRNETGWMTALFTLIFVAVPALLGFYFLLPAWNGGEVLFNRGVYIAIGIAFVIYGIVSAWLFAHLNLIAFEGFAYYVPLAIVFSGILVSYGAATWARALIAFALIFTAFPANMVVTWFKETKVKNNK